MSGLDLTGRSLAPKGGKKMAYAKFVTRTGKDGKPVSYGPYYYKSVRTAEGKVQSVYLGTKAKEGHRMRLSGLLRQLGIF